MTRRGLLGGLWLVVLGLLAAALTLAHEEWYRLGNPFTTSEQFGRSLARSIVFPLAPFLLLATSVLTWSWLGGNGRPSRGRARAFIGLLWLGWVVALIALPMAGRWAGTAPRDFEAEYNLARVIGVGALAIGLTAFILSGFELVLAMPRRGRLHPGQLTIVWVIALTADGLALIAFPNPLHLWEPSSVAVAVILIGVIGAGVTIPIATTWRWLEAKRGEGA